jgi:hypothetical protein
MRIELTDGFYQTRSLIADAQRCLNLIPEVNKQGAASQVTHYPAPGKALLATVPAAPVRGLWVTANGLFFVAAGNAIYQMDKNYNFTLMGKLSQNGTTPVYMMDDGKTLIIVDGSGVGFRLDLKTLAFTQITDEGFMGGEFVDYVDGFFVLNETNTQTFYISDAFGGTFTYPAFASKETYADKLIRHKVVQGELWLFGAQNTEVYFNVGGADFPFQAMPGVYIEHGCIAKHSVAKTDAQVFWLSQDAQGQGIVLKGNNGQATRVSTHAIEETFATYPALSDAIGYTYQQQGHTFYVLTFPSADATWVYDLASGLWTERGEQDGNGTLHRDAGSCHVVFNGMNVVGDYLSGNLYQLDPTTFKDSQGNPQLCLKSFPTLMNNAERVRFLKMILDMQVGVGQATGDYTAPFVSVRWSDDGGYTWGNRVEVPLGKIGEYMTRATLWRLGYGTRRVFEVSWALPMQTVLQGAWVDVEPCRS